MSHRTRTAAGRAQRTPALRTAARVGYAANGVLNILIGMLALGVAGAGVSEGASPGGALSGLAQTPGGLVVLVVLVVGFTALAVWHLVQAVLERDADTRRAWMSRVKFAGKAVAYLVIAAIGVGVVLGSSSGGRGAEEGLTARLLATPGGVVLVVLVAAGVLALAGHFVVKGVRRTFLDDIRAPSGALGTAVTIVGVAGYVARGIAFAAIGVLFVAAAVTADPEKAGGLDDALAALSALPSGQVVLVGIAAGFAAFGVYSFARARFARL